jgi:hypothetical protein
VISHERGKDRGVLTTSGTYHSILWFTGWLEPLLNRISQDENTVAVPLADHISAETFEFRPVDIESMYMGGFDFDLNFVNI